MRLSIAVFVVLFGAALATAQTKDPMLVGHPSTAQKRDPMLVGHASTAQKKDPMLVGHSSTAQTKDPMLVGHSSKHADTAQRSLSQGAVAAALNKKSTTASDLAKIERRPANQPIASKPAATPPPKNFGAGQDKKENRNKPMNSSRPHGLGHRSLHPKTNAS